MQHSIHDGRSLGGLNTTESCFSKQKESRCIHRGAENGSGSPIVEKTLYVDIVHKVESLKVKSLSPDSKGKPSLTKNDFRILARSKRITGTHLEDSCMDNDNSNIFEEVQKRQPNHQRDESLLKRNQEFSQDFTFPEFREDSYISRLEVPVPPPLPKSPTDSWLRRTLPSTSSKKLSVWSKTSSGDLELKTNAKTT